MWACCWVEDDLDRGGRRVERCKDTDKALQMNQPMEIITASLLIQDDCIPLSRKSVFSPTKMMGTR